MRLLVLMSVWGLVAAITSRRRRGADQQELRRKRSSMEDILQVLDYLPLPSIQIEI